MDFLRRAAGSPRLLGVFPGAFNPPTRAHIALAKAALSRVDEVVFVLPRVFPHKNWEGAGFGDRVRMLERCAHTEPRFSIAASERGLFIEIARECRSGYGPVALWFLCGADAAERIVNWDYGEAGAIHSQLREYGLLVAPRLSGWTAPPGLEDAVIALAPAEPCEDISSTAVRDRIRAGEPWKQLVPDEIVELVEEIYGRS
jgi:nicotinate (nicotinamide) nucleotide adenylyltransferase